MKPDFQHWAEGTTLNQYAPYLRDADVGPPLIYSLSAGPGHFLRAFALQETGRMSIELCDTAGEPITGSVFQLDVCVAKPRTTDGRFSLIVDGQEPTDWEIDRKNCLAFRRPLNARADKRTGRVAEIVSSDPCFGILCYRKVG